MNKKMKSILTFIIFVNFCFSQQKENFEVEVINAFIKHFEQFSNEELTIYNKQIAFEKQNEFFTKSNFTNYTLPTLGVDSKKVKRLIKKVDFNYLQSIQQDLDYWNNSLIKNAKFSSEITQNKKETFQISKPVFSKSSKYAFVYYVKDCGYLDCSSTSVIIFKRCSKGKWKFFTQMPITIS